MDAELNTKEQLLLLKDLTERTGVLHEAQVLQLKYWFFMLYPEVSKFEIMFDPEDSTLIYKVLSVKDEEQHRNNNNFSYLKEYVKFLLGTRYILRVENGR